MVGYYWIDPNEGPADDAVKVFCDFTFNATCVYPDRSKVRFGLTRTLSKIFGNDGQLSEIFVKVRRVEGSFRESRPADDAVKVYCDFTLAASMQFLFIPIEAR